MVWAREGRVGTKETWNPALNAAGQATYTAAKDCASSRSACYPIPSHYYWPNRIGRKFRRRRASLRQYVFHEEIVKMNIDKAPRLVPVKYEYDTTRKITIPSGPPFDGKPVLIQTSTGWVEAWWCASTHTETPEGIEYEGFCWVYYDDLFQCELDDALYWMPIPVKDAER